MGVSSKKSSKQRPKEVDVNQVNEQSDAAPVQSKKRSGVEIDEIFSLKKNKKTRVTEPSNDVKGKSGEKKKNEVATGSGAESHKLEKRVKRKNKLPADGDLFGDSSKPRKKMSGLKIYTEEELGLNKPDAGGTPLCPFDCDCCF
ncbi:hypothetical protein QQ045_028475 [Rhodiola kirilowii]